MPSSRYRPRRRFGISLSTCAPAYGANAQLVSCSAHLVACSRIHLRCGRSFPIGVLIEHRRDSVRPTLRSIEVLPNLQLTQKSERY